MLIINLLSKVTRQQITHKAIYYRNLSECDWETTRHIQKYLQSSFQLRFIIYI